MGERRRNLSDIDHACLDPASGKFPPRLDIAKLRVVDWANKHIPSHAAMALICQHVDGKASRLSTMSSLLGCLSEAGSGGLCSPNLILKLD